MYVNDFYRRKSLETFFIAFITQVIVSHHSLTFPMNVSQDVTTDNFNFQLPQNFFARTMQKKNFLVEETKTTKQENFLNFYFSRKDLER